MHIINNKIKATADKFGCTFLYTGGAVRNSLLEKEFKDIDIVIQNNVDILEQFVSELAKELNVKYTHYNRSGAYLIRYDNIDYEFVYTKSYIDDEKTRDFTINALYSEKLEKDIFYFSNTEGLNDINNRIIRVLNEFVFEKDPLRMLRAIRLACQLNFTIEEYTFSLIQKNKDLIQSIAQERITDELNKIILSPKSGDGLEMLFKSGLLEIILPELTRLDIKRETDKNVMWHKIAVSKLFDKLKSDDSFVSTFNIKNYLYFGWGLWLHDTGKFFTRNEITNSKGEVIDVNFHGHEEVSAVIAEEVFIRLKLNMSENCFGYTKFLILKHEDIKISDICTDSAIRRRSLEFENYFSDMMFFGCCDQSTAKPEKQMRVIKQYLTIYERHLVISEKDRIRYFKIPVKGSDIIALYNPEDLRLIAKILKDVKDAYILGECDYQSVFSYMENIAENKYNLKKI